MSKLLSPIQVGPLRADSRVVMAPMDVALDMEGGIGDRYIDFLARRAGTGLGWVATGGLAVRKDGLSSPHQIRLDQDGYTDGLFLLAERIHAEGGKLVVQLTHAGRQTLSATTGTELIAPSPIPCPAMRERPRQLAANELPALVASFAQAAHRAAKAGADGIELHMGHGYLLNQFLSPSSNAREDEYGGDLHRRCRFPLDVLVAVRRVVGPSLAVIARISADEKMEGGIDPHEACEIARNLEIGGADAIHVSACTYGSMVWNIPVYLLPDATFRPLAMAIRGAVNVPVIGVGRLHTPALMEEVIARGDADLISVGRPLLADPDYLVQLRGGHDPRPCLKCNRCINSIGYGPVACTVNPAARDGDRPLARPRRGLRTLVVGGGPAGMYAASLSAQAGHEVTLVEQRPTLGGQLDLASTGPHKGAVLQLWRHLEDETRGAGVEVVTQTRADASLVSSLDPERIIDATGSAPLRADFPGDPDFAVLTVDEALRSPPPRSGVVVVFGAGPGGVETAQAFADRGLEVILAEMRPRIGVGMVPHARYHAERLLREAGVGIVTRVTGTEVEGDRLRLVQRRGEKRVDGVSLLVLAIGRKSTGLDPAIYAGSRACVVRIGDAVQPASILEALETARRAAEELTELPKTRP